MPSGVYKRTKKAKENISKEKRGSKNPMFGKCGKLHPRWVGDDIGYRGIHHWIKSILGQAKKCSKCNKVGNGRQIHWANIDHKYRRKKEEWMQLCSKCHGEYDKVNKLRKHYGNNSGKS